MEKAIKKAKDSGWSDMVTPEKSFNHNSTYLLDPLFWQALKNSEGWGKGQPRQVQKGIWIYKWHRFIDHLAEGKDADSFFEKLLTL